jgi:hypothetical protein
MKKQNKENSGRKDSRDLLNEVLKEMKWPLFT